MRKQALDSCSVQAIASAFICFLTKIQAVVAEGSTTAKSTGKIFLLLDYRIDSEFVSLVNYHKLRLVINFLAQYMGKSKEFVRFFTRHVNE